MTFTLTITEKSTYKEICDAQSLLDSMATAAMEREGITDDMDDEPEDEPEDKKGKK